MVAGATGIDLFLLVIDAGEGARPQTHEHLAILRLLGIEHGVVAVTKADAVDEETLELGARGGARARSRGGGRRRRARRPARASTSCAPRSPRAADRVADAAHRAAAGAPLRRPRLHAARDRHGRRPGRSGRARSARATSCGPSRPGCDVRVRSVQVHDRAGRAGRGRPAGRASRCPGVERSELRRGDALVAPGAYPARATGSTSRSRSSSRSRTARACTSTTARRPSSPASCASATLRAAAARRAGRRGARRPRRPPRRDDRRRRRRARPGSPAPRRPGALRAGRGAAKRRVHAPALVDGEWAFSDEWLGRARSAELEHELAGADPLDPGIDRAGRAVGGGRRSPGSRSSGAARSSTCRARPGRSVSARPTPSGC